jgi:succinyl-CoA synthetase beta subunit
MHIHEYQAKTLFSRNNIKTPKGALIANTKEASKACSELGGGISVVKAQVHILSMNRHVHAIVLTSLVY